MPSAYTRALSKLASAKKLQTNLSSEDLSKIRAGIRQRAIFSARVQNAEVLDRIKKVVTETTNGTITREQAMGRLKAFLKRKGYVPEPGDKGTIKDLTSDQRLKLIVETNQKMAEGHGRWANAQVALSINPYWELYRKETRVEPRNWALRWLEAGGRFEQGRMIAPVNDPIWTAISAFGLPYPPFDFNSGMSTKVPTGIKLPKVKQKRIKVDDFNEDLEHGLMVDDPDIRKQLMEDLGPGFKINAEGVLQKGR